MDIKIDTLVTAHSYIETLYDAIKKIVENIRIKAVVDNSIELTKVIDGLEWIFEVVTLTQDVQFQKIDISEIKPVLNEIIDALQNTDFIVIADLLEYEVLEKLEVWHEKIGMILETSRPK